jgi:hypothetical protein
MYCLTVLEVKMKVTTGLALSGGFKESIPGLCQLLVSRTVFGILVLKILPLHLCLCLIHVILSLFSLSIF